MEIMLSEKEEDATQLRQENHEFKVEILQLKKQLHHMRNGD